MNEDNGYLVRIWPDESLNARNSYFSNEKELFKFIDSAVEEKLKISVFKVGECLMDWS